MKLFRAIGNFSVTFRWIVVIVWIVAVPLTVKNLPSLASVTNANNVQFLPSTSPSQQAANLLTPFQGKAKSTATIVLSANAGQLTTADNQAITKEEQAVKALPHVILVRDQGASKDQQAHQILIGFDIPSTSSSAVTVIYQVRGTFIQMPADLTVHLANGLADTVDSQAQSGNTRSNTQIFSLLLIIVLLLVVYRSLLAPVVTLLPAVISLMLAGPLAAEITQRSWIQASPITQLLMIVLVLGAGTDYGLFLVFRVREELRRGLKPKEAVVQAVSHVGESITFSAATVVAALVTLLLASFGIYKGLGPALGLSIAVTLLAALTLLPALLAIFGRAMFWPFKISPGQPTIGLWGRLADRVIQKPVVMLAVGVVIFGSLASGVVGYKVGGFTQTNTAPASSDSAQGSKVIAAHFSQTSNNPESLVVTFKTPVWDNNLDGLAKAQQELSHSQLFQSVSGPLNPAGITLTPQQLARLHSQLGAVSKLSPTPPSEFAISNTQGTQNENDPAHKQQRLLMYQAYLATAQYISRDGRTIQFSAKLQAGTSGTQAAINTVPAVRSTLAKVASDVGASSYGVAGQDAASFDIGQTSANDLKRIVPIVLVIIALLLMILLRSLVAPWYLILTVGLSYLAALGFAMIVFVRLGGQPSVSFILPFLMFVFTMALGEDYNILVMSRIREEAHREKSLRAAITKAIGYTGGTITSAGLILAGTFATLAIVGGSSSKQVQQVGFSVAFGILLDTFFVRTLLVPSIAILLGRWNWWPSQLFSESSSTSTNR